MNKYKFSKNTTENVYEKNSYIYGVLTSFREKINAPAKRKKVSEQDYPAITANSNNATILVIFIIGLTAGPAVSL